MKDLISIIIPTYNSEKYIARTIDSIMNQSYQNIEIIIVDDGSQDGTKSIVEKYNLGDNKIRYFYQKNSGAPVARNYGFSKARGKYIIFFDSDDEMLPNGIMKLYEKALESDYDLIMGNFFHNLNGKRIRHEQNDIVLNSFLKKNSYGNGDFKVIYYAAPVPGNKMYKKSFLVNNKLKFKTIKIGQDLNYYLNSLSFRPKLGVIEQDIFQKNILSESITYSFNLNVLDIIKAFNEVSIYGSTINNTLKFNHYNFQLAKVPFIKKKADRIFIYNSLIKEIKRIPIENVDSEFINVNINKVYFALENSCYFTSNIYRFYRILKSYFVKKISNIRN